MYCLLHDKDRAKLCVLLKHKLINTIDAIEYCNILTWLKLPQHRNATIHHIRKLYNELY